MAAVRGVPESPGEVKPRHEIVPISQKGQQPVKLWNAHSSLTELQQSSAVGVGHLFIEFSDGEVFQTIRGTCVVVDDDRGVLLTADHNIEAPNDSFYLMRITVSFGNDQRGMCCLQVFLLSLVLTSERQKQW